MFFGNPETTEAKAVYLEKQLLSVANEAQQHQRQQQQQQPQGEGSESGAKQTCSIDVSAQNLSPMRSVQALCDDGDYQ